MAWWKWFPLVLLILGCASGTEEKLLLLNGDGVTMFARGDYRSARESFEMALELSPQDTDLLFNLGQCYDRLGDYPRAESYYVQCLQRASGQTEARYALGMVYYKTGRKNETVRLINEWLVERPREAAPYALDGWRLRQEKDYFQAQGRLEQALGLDSQNIHALTEMGILFETLGMQDRALVMYERALARQPAQPELVQRLEQFKTRNVGRPLPD